MLDAGQRHFGENRVQEAQGKWPELRAEYTDVVLHLVGQLQSNKAEDAVRLFDVIHSLDRPSLVTALAKAMERTGRRIPCFLQVNIGEEPQKGGCVIADVPELIAQARAEGIELAGLMCVPPVARPAMAQGRSGSGIPAASVQPRQTVLHPGRMAADAPAEPAPYFALLAKIAREQGLAGLSMGMSGDYETAVMLGATHVRVGTALFGEREYM